MFSKWAIAAFVASAVLAPFAAAQTPEQVAAVHEATMVGAEIYAHDRAAWLATDAMLAAVAHPDAEGIHGWITERAGDDIVVTFVRSSGASLFAAYRAVYRDATGAHIQVGDRPPP